MDLGNYEVRPPFSVANHGLMWNRQRFLHVNLTKDHNITTGKVYHQVILRERRGDYLGKTVQVVPHITNAVQDWIQKVASVSVDGSGDRPDICLVEVGGTVGDIESLVFLEALRQVSWQSHQADKLAYL